MISDKRVGGGQIAALRLAEALSQAHEVTLMCACPEDADPEPPAIPENVWELESFPGHIRHYFPRPLWLLITVLDFILPPWRWGRESGVLVRALNGWYQSVRKRHLKQIISPHDFDVINSHVWQADYFIGECMPRDWSVPWVITMHGCYETLSSELVRHPEFESQIRNVLNRADQILITAKKHLDVLSHVNGIRLKNEPVRVFNGIAPVPDNLVRDHGASHPGAELVLVLVSRAIAEKGWEQAINAVIQLSAETDYRLKLILVGGSTFQRDLSRKYTHPSITFMGHQTDPISIIQQCDLGLLPSYFISESYPLSVIEYLASGIPVIATDIGEIPAMMSHEGRLAGTLIPLGAERIVTIKNASAVVFRKAICNEIGGAPEHLRLCGDWMTWARMLTLCDIAFHPKPLNFFRVSHAASQRTQAKSEALDIFEGIDVFKSIDSAAELSPSEYRKAFYQHVSRWAMYAFAFRYSFRLNKVIFTDFFELSRDSRAVYSYKVLGFFLQRMVTAGVQVFRN